MHPLLLTPENKGLSGVYRENKVIRVQGYNNGIDRSFFGVFKDKAIFLADGIPIER